MKTKIFSLTFLISLFFISAGAQPGEKRIQYAQGLKNAYFGVSLGYINYSFSRVQLEPGFTVQSVSVPHLAPRITLYGYQFNKYLSARITYMRPVQWVKYTNVNGDQTGHSVWMNVGGLTFEGYLPLGKRFSLSGEAGLGMITRRGFEIDYKPVIKHATYATGLFGAGLQYHLNSKWDLQLTGVLSPANKKEKQPVTEFYGVGFNYHLKELSKERVRDVQQSGFHFPRQLLQAGYSTNALGYGVNNLFSKTLPIFWGGAAELKSGVSINFQRNIFHSRKVFSLDIGTGMGFWMTREKEQRFFTASVYPVLRFIPIRSKQADFYFEYTVAGPTFISKTYLDDEKTGRNFTFYDAMGIGLFAGKQKTFNAGLRIAHFSNGNIFPNNNGVKVPLTFSLGYSWP
jgi:hypothetical protein